MFKMNKIYNKFIIYLISLFGICTILFIIKTNIDNNDSLSNYILDGKMNYEIEAKPGMITGDNTGNQSLFVSSTVNNILVDLDYKFTLDENINFKYKYEINSYVISELDDSSIENKEVFRKQQKLINYNYTNTFSNVFYIKDKVSLNYDYYNNIAKEYNNSVNIAVKSKLLLELKVFVEFENNQKEEYKYTLTLPLEKNTFSINSSNKEYKGKVLSNNRNIKELLLNILIIASVTIFIVLIIFELKKFFKFKKSHYLEFKYRKIMKDYENIVVPINALPKDKDIVCIKTLYFKSMIDIQKELHLPILCYKRENIVVYMIINNKLAYIYFLNSNKEKL
ncbi:MAG: hypothetical protein E7174_00330 [Firmicutes bacterium]|nr:hypothetical protein [Bacillota bacterium]